jgi:hypothetical protein
LFSGFYVKLLSALIVGDLLFSARRITGFEDRRHHLINGIELRPRYFPCSPNMLYNPQWDA